MYMYKYIATGLIITTVIHNTLALPTVCNKTFIILTLVVYLKFPLPPLPLTLWTYEGPNIRTYMYVYKNTCTHTHVNKKGGLISEQTDVHTNIRRRAGRHCKHTSRTPMNTQVQELIAYSHATVYICYMCKTISATSLPLWTVIRTLQGRRSRSGWSGFGRTTFHSKILIFMNS